MTRAEFVKIKKTMTAFTNNMYDGIYSLTKAIEDDNIDISDVSDCIDILIMNKRQRILTEHQKHYHVWYAQKDKRWKTKVPDFCGNRGEKLIARTTKENLENSIIEHYEKHLAPVRTLLTIYSEWIESKQNETSLANVAKLQNVWTRYYEDADIVKKALKDLTAGDIKNFLYKVLNERNLKKKQYNEFKSVINMMLDYSVEHEYISTNKARQVSAPPKNKFRVDECKPIEEIIFSKDAQKSLIEKAVAKFNETHNTCYLAICLNFQLGLRVGELAALKSTDILGDVIKIEREEVCVREEGADKKLHKKGTTVVPHTKTTSGNRILPLTPDAKKYINLILDFNKDNGLVNPDGYIFINNNGTRRNASSINGALRRINGTRNKKDGYEIVGCPSGNHAIRKSVISNLHNSMKVPDVTIKEFAGHKDIATTQRYYIHPTNPMTDYKDVFADAFKA